MHNEQVFTPKPIVDIMLDGIGYCGHGLRRKHIMDNSCGDGNFLVEIANRYIQQCIDDGENKETIENELGEFICGIEIDEKLCKKTIDRLNELVKLHGYRKINWQVYNADALTEEVLVKFRGKMDYVVGNPPYCNIHDFSEKVREQVLSSRFAEGGMVDLYIAFFDVGLQMVNDGGKLAYITPNGWMTSLSGKAFRRYVTSTTKCLDGVIQCGHNKIFDNATTFTAITFLDKWKTNNDFEWAELADDYCNSPNLGKPFNVIVKTTYNDCKVNGNIYLGTGEEIQVLRDILTYDGQKYFHVKNGFATLEDKVFIIKNNGLKFEEDENIINVTKATTGERHRAIFPYNKNGKAVDFLHMSNQVVSYLSDRATETDRKDKPFVYGRAQGINDVRYDKIAFNSIIKSADDIRYSLVKGGEGVYGGLYILPDDNKYLYDFNEETFHFKTTFINFIKTLGKYKNGGYYTFSSKDLESYLNYMFDKKMMIEKY